MSHDTVAPRPECQRCIHFSTLCQVVHSAATNAPAERERCWQSLTPKWRIPSASFFSASNAQGGTDASTCQKRRPLILSPAAPDSHPHNSYSFQIELVRARKEADRK